MMVAAIIDQITTAHQRLVATRSWKSLRCRVTCNKPWIRPSSATRGVNWENTDSPSTLRNAPPSSPLAITFSALALLVTSESATPRLATRLPSASNTEAPEMRPIWKMDFRDSPSTSSSLSASALLTGPLTARATSSRSSRRRSFSARSTAPMPMYMAMPLNSNSGTTILSTNVNCSDRNSAPTRFPNNAITTTLQKCHSLSATCGNLPQGRLLSFNHTEYTTYCFL